MYLFQKISRNAGNARNRAYPRKKKMLILMSHYVPTHSNEMFGTICVPTLIILILTDTQCFPPDTSNFNMTPRLSSELAEDSHQQNNSFDKYLEGLTFQSGLSKSRTQREHFEDSWIWLTPDEAKDQNQRRDHTICKGLYYKGILKGSNSGRMYEN